MLLDPDEKALSLQVGERRFAAFVAIHAAVLFGNVVVHAGGLREDVQHGEIVAAAHFKVVEVVRRRDLHAARTEFAVDVFVGDHGNFAVGERKLQRLSDQMLIAFVFRMNGDGLVAEERFRTRRRHDDAFGAVGAGITDFPDGAFFFLVFHFKVRHGRLELAVPVHEARAAIDEAFFIELHEGVDDDLREFFVHREVGVLPVDAVAEATHLREDGSARELLPFPDLFEEGFAADVALVDPLGFELAFHDDLRRDTRVVGAGNPHGTVAVHAVEARERIHHRLIEGVTHVENPRDVGRRQLDGKARLRRVGAGAEVAALFPNGIPACFDVGRLEALGEFLIFGLRHDRKNEKKNLEKEDGTPANERACRGFSYCRTKKSRTLLRILSFAHEGAREVFGAQFALKRLTDHRLNRTVEVGAHAHECVV